MLCHLHFNTTLRINIYQEEKDYMKHPSTYDMEIEPKTKFSLNICKNVYVDKKKTVHNDNNIHNNWALYSKLKRPLTSVFYNLK